MKDITNRITDELLRLGADLAGFGDLTTGLPSEVRDGLTVGISIGVCVPPEISAESRKLRPSNTGITIIPGRTILKNCGS